MRKAAVIGHPVSQSLSPTIHGYWLKRYNISGSYGLLDLPPHAASSRLANLSSEGLVGANVTIPYKELALSMAEEASPLARAVGAANTLWLENGILKADNTDVHGFVANLDESVPDWDKAGGKALVLGAGGAARAIIMGLAQRGFEIVLSNRSLDKAQKLQNEFPNFITSVIEWQNWQEALQEFNLVVNTTSLGMVGQPHLSFDVYGLKKSCIVTDIVYKPLITPLLRDASTAGLTAVTGIGMLLHQAVPGFERWFGVRPEVDEGLRSLVLKKLVG